MTIISGAIVKIRIVEAIRWRRKGTGYPGIRERVGGESPGRHEKLFFSSFLKNDQNKKNERDGFPLGKTKMPPSRRICAVARVKKKLHSLWRRAISSRKAQLQLNGNT